MIVKLTQDLARGFAPWKAMFYENEAELTILVIKYFSNQPLLHYKTEVYSAEQLNCSILLMTN